MRSIATYGVKLTSLKTTLLSAAIGCCILNALPTAADAIKIGFNAPLTGFAASVAKLVLNGAKLSVKQVNAKQESTETNSKWIK